MDRSTYDIYLDILRRELVCALGCTEPIAVAYVAALARDALGAVPEHLEVSCSGNIIKNVKSVTVPNSGDQRGIEAAATLGAVGGDATRALEVLEGVGEKDRQRTRELVSAGFCSVSLAEGVPNLYVRTVATGQGHTGVACVAGRHTNVVELSRDGVTVSVDGVTANEQDTCGAYGEPEEPGLSSLSLEGIWEFAHEVDVEDIREMVERQVELNAAISDEGLSGDWGARIGKTLLLTRPDDISCRARAAAAAGSDARMSGCAMPVVINCGSGNQGITCSLPVAEYARYLRVPHDEMLRGGALGPHGHPRQALHWRALGVLRCRDCGDRSRGGRVLSARGLLWAVSGDHCEHTGKRGRHRVRRRQAKLRGKDCGSGGRGDSRLRHGAGKRGL